MRFCIALLVGLISVPATAAVINVPGDFAKIQDAIDAAAASGDEIIVALGTYPEVINFKGKAIYLHSASGNPADTIIDGMGFGNSVVLCISGEGAGTILEGFTITGGNTGLGGGMFNLNSSPIITNCVFKSNTSTNRGGGMYNNSSSPTVFNCTFSGNTAFNGGGIFNLNSSLNIITNCIFSRNTANSSGGGMYNSGSSLTVTNCTFSGNSAGAGGGMYNINFSNPTVTNCTLSGNTANIGGGMYNNLSSPTSTNCIFWGDSPDEIFNINTIAPPISFSNVQGGYAGTGNIDVNPLFIDAAGPDAIPGTNDDDLRLSDFSLAIDAGDNTTPGLTGITSDLDGNPRFFDDTGVADTGNGIAPIVDMGAYEGQAASSFDCNGNGIPDNLDIANGTSQDCNGNGVPDECDIATGFSLDCNGNGVPDECEPDCNGNGIPDECDIATGFSLDCNGNGVPDECDPDCNGNGFPDECDITSGTSQDCNLNGVPDNCDIVPLNPVPFVPENFTLDWSDAADDANSGIVPIPFVGAVTIGGVTYTDFVMDSNGYVELLRSAETPYNFGFGAVDVLVNHTVGGGPTHTYLMAGYDDLISSFAGVEYGYDIQADRIVFYWNTETWCDHFTGRFLEMQIVLIDDGTVQWHFIRSDDPCFDNDLFSGIYLGHDQQVLHEIARDMIPVGQSWNFSDVPFSADANGNGNPDECDFTSRLFSLNGPGNGTGWSWCVTGDFIGTVCNTNVTGVTGTTLAVAQHFADSINSDPTPDIELSAQATPSLGIVYLSVQVKGLTPPSLCVGPSGGPASCCPTFLINDCSFNPSMQEVPISPLDCNGNGQSDTIDIVFEVSQDANNNGIPDECEPFCPADTNSDSMVNVTDLLALLGAWGPNPGHVADINSDGNVNVTDLLALLGAWGVCP